MSLAATRVTLGRQILDAKTPYDVLSLLGKPVTHRSTAVEIRSAYLRLSVQVHPDKIPGRASEPFMVLTRAYEQLQKRETPEKPRNRLKRKYNSCLDLEAKEVCTDEEMSSSEEAEDDLFANSEDEAFIVDTSDSSQYSASSTEESLFSFSDDESTGKYLSAGATKTEKNVFVRDALDGFKRKVSRSTTHCDDGLMHTSSSDDAEPTRRKGTNFSQRKRKTKSQCALPHTTTCVNQTPSTTNKKQEYTYCDDVDELKDRLAAVKAALRVKSKGCGLPIPNSNPDVTRVQEEIKTPPTTTTTTTTTAPSAHQPTKHQKNLTVTNSLDSLQNDTVGREMDSPGTASGTTTTTSGSGSSEHEYIDLTVDNDINPPQKLQPVNTKTAGEGDKASSTRSPTGRENVSILSLLQSPLKIHCTPTSPSASHKETVPQKQTQDPSPASNTSSAPSPTLTAEQDRPATVMQENKPKRKVSKKRQQQQQQQQQPPPQQQQQHKQPKQHKKPKQQTQQTQQEQREQQERPQHQQQRKQPKLQQEQHQQQPQQQTQPHKQQQQQQNKHQQPVEENCTTNANQQQSQQPDKPKVVPIIKKTKKQKTKKCKKRKRADVEEGESSAQGTLALPSPVQPQPMVTNREPTEPITKKKKRRKCAESTHACPATTTTTIPTNQTTSPVLHGSNTSTPQQPPTITKTKIIRRIVKKKTKKHTITPPSPLLI